MKTFDLDEIKAACRDGGYWYVATPYSKYPSGPDRAWWDACAVAGWLVGQGVPIYCPIAHTHPIADAAALDKLDHAVWLDLDARLAKGAVGLLVVKMPGWDRSEGIRQEIEWFLKSSRPVMAVDEELFGGCRILPRTAEEHYWAIGREIEALHRRKGADYGNDGDPFANLRAAKGFGMPAWHGVALRLEDKMSRLRTAVRTGTLANESIEDTLLDMANYARLALALYRESQL